MRYYFHLNECGVVTPDDVGAELADLPAARALAVQEARIVMCVAIKAGQLCLDCHIDIADAGGTVVGVTRFREAVRVSGGEFGPGCH